MTADEQRAPIRVGLVEDDPEFRARIAGELEQSPDVKRVLQWESAEEFWNDRAGRSVDVLFLDIQLGQMRGVELTE